MRTAVLPVLRQSGKLINQISPRIGNRVESWVQQREQPVVPELTEEELERMTSHTFHPNGLLLVNSKGKHPILALIDRAEKAWRSKISRQSKTLSEAVAEYKRRYRRNPPKGFDDWWNFCERHNVQLRDEYDQIHRDLLPHWALEPSDSRHRNRVMQDRPHTFTVSMRPGEPRARAHGEWAHIRRATDMAELMSKFAGSIPRVLNMTFIMDDNPALMLSYTERERMIELAEEGEYLGPSEFFAQEDPDLSNFAQACAPSSPLRKAERGEPYPDFSPARGRSYIWEHSKASDLCAHPEIRKFHGHTMQQGVPLTGLAPLFTWAKTRLHSDILVTPLEQYSDSYVAYEPPWHQKSENRLLWRGSTTGVEFDKHTPWRNSQRARLHFMSQNNEGDKEVMWSYRGAVRESNFSVESLNHLYLDTAFSGEPAQCDPETCEIMRKTIHFKPIIGLDESNQYKYVMDVDGNGWSGRFHRLMSMRSAVLKSTVFPEWYQDRIQPWIHYIPVKVDYSDLYDIMAFFVGTPDGQGSHDSLGERIGEAGRQWALRYWRRVDMAAYMFRLALEYNRILHHDEEEVDFILPTEAWL